MTKTITSIFGLLLLLVATPAAVQAQGEYYFSPYYYDINADNSVTITYYNGADRVVMIPVTISNLLVTGIEDNAFYQNYYLNSITISSNITFIGDSSFEYCDLLTNVTIANGVLSIGDYAFYGCSDLVRITIPESVTSLGDNVFNYCDSLKGITVDPQNAFYSSTNGVLFDKSVANLIQFPAAENGSYAIPSSVSNVESFAFAGSTGLVEVAIPANVVNIGDYAFRDCYGLTNAIVSDGVSSIGEQAFFNCGSLTGITIPSSVTNIGQSAFEYCANLTSISIPGKVNTIGEGAFYACNNLTNATIIDGVTAILGSAFYGCSSLTSVKIPGSVISIAGFAFFSAGLTNVYFEGNAPSADPTVFESGYGFNKATAYYLPGTTGWGNFSANAGIPAVLWNPLIQAGDGSFGVSNNQFGFNITATNNFTVVVEACTNLANPVWTPLQTITLTNGSAYFSDPGWLNYPSRYYGLGLP